MSRFSTVRGWLECDFAEVKLIRNAVESDWVSPEKYVLTQEQIDLYRKGWVFPEAPINWTSFVFFGASVNERAVPFIKDTLRAISSVSEDISGVFFVDNEDGETSSLWELESGTLRESPR